MSWLKTLGRQGLMSGNTYYPNGGQVTWKEGYITYIKYDSNCPDQIWLTFEDGEYKVTRVLTHDGLEFTGSSCGDVSS